MMNKEHQAYKISILKNLHSMDKKLKNDLFVLMNLNNAPENENKLAELLAYKMVNNPEILKIQTNPGHGSWISNINFNTHGIPKRPEYRFLNPLNTTRVYRIDIMHWKNAANLLLNFCNSHKLATTNDQEIEKLSHDSFFLQRIEKLHQQEISSATFKQIQNHLKPIISFQSNPVNELRKNILFLLMYIQQVDNYKKSLRLNTEQLARQWLYFFISEGFDALTFCTYLSKSYHVPNKLSIQEIKQFIEIDLSMLELQYLRNADFGWLDNIRETANQLLPNYRDLILHKRSADLTFLSKDSQELLIFLFMYHATVFSDFPYALYDVVENLLLKGGISSSLVKNVVEEVKQTCG
jgi:hypothetical protein